MRRRPPRRAPWLASLAGVFMVSGLLSAAITWQVLPAFRRATATPAAVADPGAAAPGARDRGAPTAPTDPAPSPPPATAGDPEPPRPAPPLPPLPPGPDDLTLPPAAPRRTDRLLVLLLGTDERPGNPGRSDTMLVASVESRTGRVALVSLPRDTWAPIPGVGWDKLNHAWAYGPRTARQKLPLATVSALLDIPLEHYAVVNFNGFKDLVDAVGGIEVTITEEMHYDDEWDGPEGLHIHFLPGRQRLDGQKALEYVRYREDGDFGRMRRQQEVLGLVLARALSPENYRRIPALVTAAVGAGRTDLGAQDLLRLATGFQGRAGAVQTATLDQGRPLSVGYPDRMDVLVPDLVDFRSKAYRLLLGADPPEAFMARARQAQAVVAEALERQLALDKALKSRAAARESDPVPAP